MSLLMLYPDKVELSCCADAAAELVKLYALYRVTLKVDEDEAPKESFRSNVIEYTFIGSNSVGAN